ncbi:MAG: hypothetical protein AYK22_07420 [Thermoplasmatales archaeon SG8-52-3]|nr:MAG: hypothetical protein AYK22_07420 [Thermoplasmatales archaeon SG8-52-3]
MHVLPDKLRDLLKTPVGTLVDEKGLIKILRNKKKIISIGDQVTYTILKNEIEPSFCVVDFKTKRGACPKEIVDVLKSFGKKSVVVENPAGTLSDDLFNTIKLAVDSLDVGSLRIEVVGEEDLASLPAIFFAPPDATIIYGLPNKGVLVVKPTKDMKEKVKEVLDEM